MRKWKDIHEIKQWMVTLEENGMPHEAYDFMLAKEVKWELSGLEREGTRREAYDFLLKCWEECKDSERITVLMMQELVIFLKRLEEPRTEWESEDEYDQYQRLLQMILRHGMDHFGEGKYFLCQLCYYLEAACEYRFSGPPAYRFLFGEVIPKSSKEAFLERFMARARALYPGSWMVELLPRLLSSSPRAKRLTKAQKKELCAELEEWSGEWNWADHDFMGLYDRRVLLQ